MFIRGLILIILIVSQWTGIVGASVGLNPETGAMTADGKRMYIANSGSNNVTVIDVEKSTVITTIQNVGRAPWAVEIAGGASFCH